MLGLFHRKTVTSGLKDTLRGMFSARSIDAEMLQQLEDVLISADTGVAGTTHILQQLNRHADTDPMEVLVDTLTAQLCSLEQHLAIQQQPTVILVVGVNGVGKTTSIAKLAKYYADNGHKVMLAAGDTFRAAAISQLQYWGEKLSIPVVAQHLNGDSASVIFDAFQSAKAKNINVLIADTAGRMHTKQGLMDELKKIARVLKKIDTAAPHEVLLMLDGNNGNNSLQQFEQFHAAIGVTGIQINKLDGSSKGGIAVALSKYAVPIRFIGIGEKPDDLAVFSAHEYAQRMVGTHDTL